MSILGVTVELEPMMFLVIGILTGGLVALALLPSLYERAEARAAQRIESIKPASVKEIQADRDALRAEFATSAFRLENHVAELRDKAATHFAELTRKATTIERLTAELAARRARIEALEVREQELEGREMELFSQLRAAKEEIARLGDAMIEAEQSLSDLAAERARLQSALDERSLTVDRQRIDIIALQNRADTVCLRVYELANFVRDCESRGAYDRIEFRSGGEVRAGSINGKPARDAVTPADASPLVPL